MKAWGGFLTDQAVHENTVSVFYPIYDWMG